MSLINCIMSPPVVEDDVVITMDAGIACRDDLKSEWAAKFHSVERRPLRCTLAVPKVNLAWPHF